MPGGYREWRPRPELASLVACVWERTLPAAGAVTATRVLPDGCVDVVVGSDGRRFVAGPDTGPVLHSVPAGATVTGLRFRVGAAGVGLDLPVAELRDERVPLDALWNGDAEEVGERVGLAADTRGRLAVLQEAVLARIGDAVALDPVVTEAALRLGRPGARVNEIGPELGVSERDLRRRFQRAVGYGPKLLDRVLRFQRFLARAGRSPDLATTAFELGYADQAHLTRACRELSGLPPTKLLTTQRPRP